MTGQYPIIGFTDEGTRKRQRDEDANDTHDEFSKRRRQKDAQVQPLNQHAIYKLQEEVYMTLLIRSRERENLLNEMRTWVTTCVAARRSQEANMLVSMCSFAVPDRSGFQHLNIRRRGVYSS